MPCENRKKSFYFEVSRKTVVLIEICVCPDVQCSKRSQQYKWFTDVHLLKLLEKLKDICLVRVLSFDSTTVQEIQYMNEIISGPNSYFYMKYIFKRRGVKQFLVMPTNAKLNESEKDHTSYSGGGHSEVYLFPERLKVFASLAPLKFGTGLTEKTTVNKGISALKTVKQETKAAVKEKSKYFGKDKDTALTMSAVKKQSNLKSIIKKMKDSVSEAESTFTGNNDQEQSSPTLPSFTVNNPCKSTGQEKETKHSLTANNVESTGKRTRQEAGLNEDACLGSDTETDDHYSKGLDFDQSDFVMRKPLSRKKRLKQASKESKDKNSTKSGKNEGKNDSNPVTRVEDENGQGSKVYEASSSGSVAIKKSFSNKYNTGKSKKTNTPSHMHLREQGKHSSNRENEQVEKETEEEQRFESITIDDAVPNFDNVKKISDLESTHINFLVQKLEKKLKNIFRGKEYCRRHEDYKKGGRSKGDLAFQVRFGLYSEDQQEAIMKELMGIFCSRHNKYLDYLTKVLLPETFIGIYMELFGGNHDEAEQILMGNEKKKETSQTDGSSTE